jgi:hypothetical protein
MKSTLVIVSALLLSCVSLFGSARDPSNFFYRISPRFRSHASGAVQSRMTVLITPEEADEATKKIKTVKYRAPGE